MCNRALTRRFRAVLLPNFRSPKLCWDSFLSSSSCQPADTHFTSGFCVGFQPPLNTHTQCFGSVVATFRVVGVSIGRRSSADLPGTGQPPAVQEDGQVHDVPHVVVSVDVGISQDGVQVLIDSFDDDVRVAGKDGDEGTLGEQHAHLQEPKPTDIDLSSPPRPKTASSTLLSKTYR